MYIQLVYNKNIEGNLFYDEDKEVYSLWDRLNDDTYDDENDSLLDKVNKVLKLLFEIEEKAEEEYDKVKCEGKFVKRKSKKKCGYNAYKEKVYKITKPGINCRHRAGYSEREFLPKCKLDEKCKIDRDCERGKCHRGTCKIEFECDWDKLDNCDESGCKKLNENVGHDKYKYSSGKCRYNSCNKEQYQNCDEDGCKNLGYKFKWNEEDKTCENRDYDIKTCSQVTCPDGYSLNENGKDYNCERKLSREDLQKKLDDKGIPLNEEDEGFISECNRDNCCKENYTCERYFAPPNTNICEGCEDGEDGECDDNCFHDNPKHDSTYYENGVEKTIYYNYKEEKGTDFFPEDSKKCRGFDCTKEECTQKCDELGEDECEGNDCDWCLGKCYNKGDLPSNNPCPDSCVNIESDVCNSYENCDWCLGGCHNKDDLPSGTCPDSCDVNIESDVCNSYENCDWCSGTCYNVSASPEDLPFECTCIDTNERTNGLPGTWCDKELCCSHSCRVEDSICTKGPGPPVASVP